MIEKQVSYPPPHLGCAWLKRPLMMIKRGLANMLWWYPLYVGSTITDMACDMRDIFCKEKFVQYRSYKQAQGFTLIEMSIALVIIGLLVGGVLVGRDLIQAAESRALMSQMEKYQVAATTFKLKYRCIAGDCLGAASYGLGPAGDGNKIVTGPGGACFANHTTACADKNATIGGNVTWYTSKLAYGERQYFWMHLANAGLINGNYSQLPSDTLPVAAENMANYFPKDAINKAYLHSFTWGGRLFIATGASFLRNFKTVDQQTAALNSSQMASIQNKLGLKLIIGANNYESLFTGQRAIPHGSNSTVNSHLFWSATGAGIFGSACVISDGSGGYKYNIENGGKCNLMWELNY